MVEVMTVSVTVKPLILALYRSPPNFVLVRACRITLPTHHHRASGSIQVHRDFAPEYDPRMSKQRPISDEDDENDEDRSLDLLVRFVENIFKKLSKKATKALRSILPIPIPSHLVGFSVNGVLLLAFLWLLKAFLQVVCTLGSVVFVSILLIRGIWSGVRFLQESRHQKMDQVDVESKAWNSAQPAS